MRMFHGVAAALVILLASAPYAVADVGWRAGGRVDPYGPDTHFEADASPAPYIPAGNPLDYAAARIGLDVRGVELPRGYGAGYRFTCRFPIIDAVANSPLYMKQWAQETSARMNRAHATRGALDTIFDAAHVLRGTAALPEVKIEDDAAELLAFRELLVDSNLSPGFKAHLMRLYSAYLRASAVASLARTNLTEEDLAFFNENLGYYIAPDGETMPRLTGSVETHMKFIGHARRFSFEYMFLAADIMAGALDEYEEATSGYELSDFLESTAAPFSDLEMDTRYGRVIISGPDNGAFVWDTSFHVDLGGSDIYVNNAGGCRSLDTPVAVTVDHSGRDQYVAPTGRYVQGFGFLGAGFLVDLEGDDEYLAQHFCQGSAILGVGVLWDREGRDTYTAQAFCQGAGAFGMGALFETSGSDVYSCATLGQGAATTLGLGLLSDLEGDDKYELAVAENGSALGQTPGYGQGGALSFRPYPWQARLTPYGGVGLLCEGAGDDSYTSRGWCDQGGSYLMSLGALVDDGGNDVYSARCGQGSGIHLTNAILVDRDGDDTYRGDFRCGGSGGDRSPGFLIDYAGNDSYTSNTSSYGTGVKPFSFSLFIDYSGQDTYVCGEPSDGIGFNNWDSFGGVWPESEPHQWPYAICLDLGGADEYSVRNRDDNTERHSFGHGIHLDTDWRGTDVIGRVDNKLEPYAPFRLAGVSGSGAHTRDIRELQNPDTFARFQAVGRLADAGSAAVPDLVDALRRSTHRQFNRDAMECIHILFAENRVTHAAELSILDLLKAADYEVRTLVAGDLGMWKVTAAEDALLAALANDDSALVRRFAMNSLRALGSTAALPAVRAFSCRDESPAIRRDAIAYLAATGDARAASDYEACASLLSRDPDSSVRVAAARALGKMGDPEAAALLRSAARSRDVYVRRAAGEALAALGEIEGIEILIESLSFPSIDAFYNYDHNVPNTIALYANADLPEEERYDVTAWRRWFESARDDIDIAGNASAARDLEAVTMAARDTSPDETVEALEAFLSRHPGHVRGEALLAAAIERRDDR